MTEQSAFSSKHIKDVTVEKRDILDELNLPAQLVSFIRKNVKNLKIGIICLALAVVSGTVYNYYTEKRKDESTALLARAFQEQNNVTRNQLLEKVVKEYPRTDAGLWSCLELAHIAYSEQNYQTAIKEYETILDKLASDNPLTPLVQYSLAQAYEGNQDLDKALIHYQHLTEFPGFADIANLTSGRIYEKKGELITAEQFYDKFINSRNVERDPVRGWIEDRLAKLKSKTQNVGEKQTN